MAAMTQDGHLVRYGTPEGHQLTPAPVTAASQLYKGEVALLRSGYLVNAASPQSTDVIVGMIGDVAGGTTVPTAPGILGGTANGSVWVNCETGTFVFQNGTGADVIAEANAGQTCYYSGENAAGPIAALTSGGNTRPQLGVIVPFDPGLPFQQGQVIVKLLNLGGGV